jgi:hypothetical protein
MNEIKFLSKDGLLYMWSQIKSYIATNAVAKEAGKTLIPTTDLEKLQGIAAGAQENVIETIKVNNVVVTPAAKAVNLSIITTEEVNSMISTAVGNISSFEFIIVPSLPATGSSSKVYLVPATSTGANNVYDEYIYVNSAWENIGTTAMDLSGYLLRSDLVAITNSEIDAILAS